MINKIAASIADALAPVKDGDTVIIGGLIDQSTAGNDRGTPGLSDVPLFGKMFGNESTSHRSRELVMVLKVKLL